IPRVERTRSGQTVPAESLCPPANALQTRSKSVLQDTAIQLFTLSKHLPASTTLTVLRGSIGCGGPWAAGQILPWPSRGTGLSPAMDGEAYSNTNRCHLQTIPPWD